MLKDGGAIFLEGIDVSMMGVALPSIRSDLGMSTSSLNFTTCPTCSKRNKAKNQRINVQNAASTHTATELEQSISCINLW
jgi:hypothetical protein